MRNVVYVAPFPMETTLRFARALASLQGVRLLGVFHRLPSRHQRRGFDDLFQVDNCLDPQQLLHAIGSLGAKHGGVHRVLGILEGLQDPLATVRQHFGIPGPDLATSQRFRDKGRMKEALRAAGIPCASYARLHSEAEGLAFAEKVGLPIILKPPAGSGCKDTYRCNTPNALRQALGQSRPSRQRPVLAEEFLTGAEHSLECLVVHGQPVFRSISRYHPTPLEVVENDWMQWCVVLPRELTGFERATEVGIQTVTRLGLADGMTHMEWFQRPDGSIAVGEIAMRPPGAQFVRLMGEAYGTDFYRAWARAVVDSDFDGPWERKHAVGIAFLRGSGRGRVQRIEGLGRAQSLMGGTVVEARLPRLGAPKSDSYEGDGWVIVKHAQTKVVEEALRRLVATVRVHYA